MDYLAYLETAWHYLPHLVYAFVFLTLLPKSLMRIKRFADADYAANRGKYHRCYGPDICCHALMAEEEQQRQKQKPRKAVSRVYPKRKASLNDANGTAAGGSGGSPNAVKRQVNAAQIQTHTNVNQIARMFEAGVRKVNRVQPILPEIRTISASLEDEDYGEEQQHQSPAEAYNYATKRKQSFSTQLSQFLMQENIENSANLLNQLHNGNDNGNGGGGVINNHTSDWHSEPLTATSQTRQKRCVPPQKLNFTGGSSATPSTASPAASSSPLSSSPEPVSPVLLRHPPSISIKSSMEDIFQAIARSAEQQPQTEQYLSAGTKTLAPVTSIDDILSERRLSRPLSAYSISDLLNEEAAAGIEETFVDSLLHALDQS